jgi:hypothetical protein
VLLKPRASPRAKLGLLRGVVEIQDASPVVGEPEFTAQGSPRAIRGT